MRHEYCTLFDSNYLPRALVLYRSLERCEEDFLLRAVCMDERSRELLSRLALPRMRVVGIDEIERADAGLLSVRAARSPWEYCWTAKASVCRFFLDLEPSIEVLTFLDADLSFSSSSEPLLDELGDGSIMLVRDRAGDFATGIYNSGWVSFRNDETGRGALAWWRERCLEWCFDRIEEGRCGEQKYLDDWPERFAGVRVCKNDAAGLAPWNDQQHRLSANGTGAVLVDGVPLIFYHHSGLHVRRGDTPSARVAGWSGRFLVTRRPILVTRRPIRLIWSVVADPPQPVLALVWKPYAARLAEAIDALRRAGAPPELGLHAPILRHVISRVLRSGPLGPVRSAYRRLPLRFRTQVRRVTAAR